MVQNFDVNDLLCIAEERHYRSHTMSDYRAIVISSRSLTLLGISQVVNKKGRMAFEIFFRVTIIDVVTQLNII